MAQTDGDIRVGALQLEGLVADIFGRCGMDSQDANLVADTLVAADLRGVHSHGVLRVPEYVRRLRGGQVDPRGRPYVVTDSGACLVVDGGNSMGQVGATFAMDRAIERASSTGIAAIAVRGSNHCGAMAYYARRAIPHDMIGIATTNALPTMAPWGGAERILGINPLAVALPAANQFPIVYDAAFSGSSHGKIRVYQQKGLPLPEGWAMDREGRPTIDPAVAIDGLLSPIGGFKGTGLALITGLLSTMLSGASYGTELGDMKSGPHPGQDGHFVIALRIAAFEQIERFKERVDRVVEQLHACRPAAGFDRIYAPGEREELSRRESLEHGIPLNRVTFDDLHSVSDELGVVSSSLLAPFLTNP